MRYFPVEMKITRDTAWFPYSFSSIPACVVLGLGDSSFSLIESWMLSISDACALSFFAILLAGFSLRGEIIRFGPTSATTIAVENIYHQLQSTEKSHTWALDVTDDAAGGIVHELDADLGDTTTGS